MQLAKMKRLVQLCDKFQEAHEVSTIESAGEDFMEGLTLWLEQSTRRSGAYKDLYEFLKQRNK